jgi:hypothetical protein
VKNIIAWRLIQTLLLFMLGTAATVPAHAGPGISPDFEITRLPDGALPAVVNAMAADLSPDWHVTAVSDTGAQAFHYRASNSRQRLDYVFTDRGLQVRPADTAGDPDWSLQFALHTYGYEGDDRLMAPAAETRVADTRIEYHYPDRALTEWYVNSPLGLEHGYTVHAPPAGRRVSEHLVFELALADNLAASIGADHRTVVFSTADGERVLSYGGLYASDATGRRLPAEMRLDGDRLVLYVADAGASYPLTIDPLFQSEQKFTPPSAGSGDHYGNAVAIEGDWMVIAAPDKDDTVADAGVVYVYKRQGDDTWNFYQRLSINDFSANSYYSQTGADFGDAVAISGGVMVIGAPGHNGDPIDPITDAGRAFVYVFNASSCSSFCWMPLQVLDAGIYQSTGDRFGDAVDVDVNTIAIGAPLDEGVGLPDDQGAVYIFQGSGSTLSLVARVTSDTTSPLAGSHDDDFGNSLALRGGWLAVGAPGDDNHAADAGAVYLYDSSIGWSLSQKILGQAITEWFGKDVDIDPDSFRMVASAHRAMANGVTYGGVVRIYTWAFGIFWIETGTLTPSGTDNTTPDSSYYGYFGNSVAFEKGRNGNEYILVGAVRNHGGPGDNCSPVCGGAAYVFEDRFDGSGPVQIRKLVASDGAAAEFYGEDVALDDYTAVIGAPRQVQGTESGATYVYSMVSTWLDVELGSHAITTSDQLSVTATLHVGGVPAPDDVLNSQPVNLRITPPNGQSYVVNGSTLASGGSGVVNFPLQGPFATPGAYTFEVTFPGTTTWLAAAAPPETVLISGNAGYLVIIEGAVEAGGTADELTHYKFASRLYQVAQDRDFMPENIFFLAQDDPNYPYPGYPYYRPEIDLDLGQHDYPYLQNYLLETDPGNGTESLVEKLQQSPGPVHIVMIDHAALDPATESGRFYLNTGGDPMTPADLNTLLAGIEAVPGMLNWPRTVTVLSCFSGSFLDPAQVPHVPGRVLLSSSMAYEEAFKGMPDQATDYPYGVREGSYFGGELLQELKRGASFRESFMIASERTAEYTRADDSHLDAAHRYQDYSRQHPLLDDNDGMGSNALSDVAGTDGWVAKDIYFGVGADYDLYPFTTSPTIFLPTPQAYCLELTPVSLIPPYWFTYISAAGMAVREPGKVLPAPSGASGQLDTPYYTMSGTRILNPNPPYGDTESYSFCRTFNTAGKWEAWLYGEDSQGKLTGTERVVVYVNGAGNSAPGNVNLLSPPNGNETGTNPAFDWDEVSDPDGKAVTYRLQIASSNAVDGNQILLAQNVVYTVDNLRGSRAYVDATAGLQDLSPYYWQVLAVDADGGWTASPVWSFETNNKNLIGTRLVGRATANSVALEGALIQINPGAGLSDEYGDYVIDDLYIGAAQSATASLAGFGNDTATVDLYAFHDTSWSPVLGQTCTPTLNPVAHAGIDDQGGSFQVDVTDTTGSCSWSAASNSPAWIQVTSGDSLQVFVGSGRVDYDVSCNTTAAPRNGSITIAGQTFNVSQIAGQDRDNDGLLDCVETKTGIYVDPWNTGTDPDNRDTDGDGLPDGDEVYTHSTDPNLADSDGDGVSDYIEVYTGTDPGDASDYPVWGDIDGDGFVDAQDVLLASRAALGHYQPALDELLRGNVAPLVNGVPSPDSGDTVIDAADLLLIQRKAFDSGLF